MALVAPHLAFPLRFSGGRFVQVEQDSRRHREDQAEIVLRTRPRTFDHQPELGARDMVGSLGPVSPALLDAVATFVDGDFEASEDIRGRVHEVAIALSEENG